MRTEHLSDVVVVGGGFAGLSAAFELSRAGVKVTVLEAEPDPGGLAAAFDVGGTKLDRFYHHWFTNDVHILRLIEELGAGERVVVSPSRTGMYYANRFFRLSSPLDLLRFRPLRMRDRIRLGLLVLRVRQVRDWRELESRGAVEWLRQMVGDAAFRVVWEPLLKGKFGEFADDVSAVWFWNKLKLRGGSRDVSGREALAYFKGGFTALVELMVKRISSDGGRILTGVPVSAISRDGDAWCVEAGSARYLAREVVVTTAPALTAGLVQHWAPPDWLQALRRIRYLANVCLVLELDRSLSESYWVNVNDPDFPFVGLIEHTNFQPPEDYGGRHIVYLSKYLTDTHPLYALESEALLDFALPYLQRMFPAFRREWVKRLHLWRARWAQPIVERNYSGLVEGLRSPEPGLHLCSMAQVYPEDRGTNYAVRDGRSLGMSLAIRLRGSARSPV